ncbi:uncharacterized protein LOC128389119 [Panonychus citri]|uniref:uncharacterized protein LOC128389119 n=1 Tax=Panonychus citri TaxID=50023 RepID=UPI00230808CB|nr:uncharacterized protein LOC128389119 [Panonychus citri]
MMRGFTIHLSFGLTSVFIVNWAHLWGQKFCIQRHDDPKVLTFMRRARIVSIAITCIEISQNVYFHINSIIGAFPRSDQWSSTLSVLEFISTFTLSTITIIAYLGNIHMFNIIYRGITLLIADFIYFNRQLIRLRNERNINLDRVSALRRFYSQAIRNTQNFERFARCEIGRLYIAFVLFYIVTAVEFFSADQPKLIILVYFIFDSTILICLTIKAIILHHFCHKDPETLYELSLPMRSQKFRDEVNLFHYRLTRNDVGFTCLGVFTLTTNFVISIITLKFTIFMAIPSFLPFIGSH